MSGMIPPDTVEQVRHACDIVDVIGSYVPLKKSGAKFKALSPFQKEKTPSFYVDPSRQIFKCFSSGHGGDVFKFLMLMENMTFPEAVRRLAQRAGVLIPESGPQDPQARSRREELQALNAAVAAWWQKLLHSDPAAEPARAYLKSREFPSSLADEFGLGYAPEGWDSTLKWAQQKGYSMDALETGKLVATSESGRTYDFFRGRLMIPVHDESGQVVAFSGRLLDPEAKAQKYVNSPETPVFIKSKILFGLNKTKRSIIEAESAILCEGQIDLMRCWQKGVRNVIAPQGTAFTDSHARILKRLAKEVIICFDADRAGQNAAQRSIDVLLKEDLQVRIARIPQGEDPDSLLRKQPVEVFQEILHDAKDYARYLLETMCETEDIASPRGRGMVAQKMAELIVKIPNNIAQERLAIEVVSRLGVPLVLLEGEIEKAHRQMKNVSREPSSSVLESGEQSMESSEINIPSTLKKSLRYDQTTSGVAALQGIDGLLSLLLTKPDLVSYVSRLLNPQWIEGIDHSEILLKLLDTHAHDCWQGVDSFLSEFDADAKNYLTTLLLDPIPIPQDQALEIMADNLIEYLKIRWISQQQQILEQEIKSGLLSSEKLLEKMQRMHEFSRTLANHNTKSRRSK